MRSLTCLALRWARGGTTGGGATCKCSCLPACSAALQCKAVHAASRQHRRTALWLQLQTPPARCSALLVACHCLQLTPLNTPPAKSPLKLSLATEQPQQQEQQQPGGGGGRGAGRQGGRRRGLSALVRAAGLAGMASAVAIQLLRPH